MVLSFSSLVTAAFLFSTFFYANSCGTPNTHQRQSSHVKPFLDCFTATSTINQKVVYDMSCKTTFTRLDSIHMLELSYAENVVPISNLCQTYRLPQKGIYPRITTFSADGRWQNPCSDVRDELDLLPKYVPVSGSITIAIAKFYRIWNGGDTSVLYQPLAKIEKAVFVGFRNNDTIRVDNFTIGYTEHKDYHLAKEDLSFRISFPRIAPINLEEISRSVLHKIEQASLEVPEHGVYLCLQVGRNGKATLVNISYPEDSSIQAIIRQHVPLLKYPLRKPFEMPDNYHHCFSMLKEQE